MSNIVLRSLHIHKPYGRSDKTYEGSIEFTGQNGEVKVRLDPKLSAAVLAVCAEAVVEASKAVAEAMTIDFTEALEAPALEATDKLEVTSDGI